MRSKKRSTGAAAGALPDSIHTLQLLPPQPQLYTPSPRPKNYFRWWCVKLLMMVSYWIPVQLLWRRNLNSFPQINPKVRLTSSMYLYCIVELLLIFVLVLMVACLSREIETERALDSNLPLKFWIKVLISIFLAWSLSLFFPFPK